ncbi:hypothetical protein RAS2_16560 [Phycisphaerae bacterium RAS2]|nr:hypothetical protein RAS2_16560 [Phycisphaerae bacterium RAS2]
MSTCNDLKPTCFYRIGQFVTNRIKKGARQLPVGNAGRIAGIAEAEVRPRPCELVRFGDDNPRPAVVQIEAALCQRRNLDGKAWVGRRRMRDWNNGHDLLTRVAADDHYYGARAILDAFLLALLLFCGPKVGVPDNKARTWLRQWQRLTRLLHCRIGRIPAAVQRQGAPANPHP